MKAFFLVTSILLLSACGPAVQATQPAAATASPTAKAKPTQTETVAPTETPDPIAKMAESIPADWGILRQEGEQWFYSSPDNVTVGKDVPVEAKTFTIEGIERQAIVVDGQWPLFIDGEQTPFYFRDVAKTLVDDQEKPIPLNFEFGGDGDFQTVECFLVISGETFTENGTEFTPAAISVNNEGLTFEMLIPQDLDWGPNLQVYPDGVYTESMAGLRGIGNGFKFSQLEIGEEFFLIANYDRSNLEANLDRVKASGNQLAVTIHERLLVFREAAKNIFDGIKRGLFHPDMLDRFELADPYIVGIGK